MRKTLLLLALTASPALAHLHLGCFRDTGDVVAIQGDSSWKAFVAQNPTVVEISDKRDCPKPPGPVSPTPPFNPGPFTGGTQTIPEARDYCVLFPDIQSNDEVVTRFVLTNLDGKSGDCKLELREPGKSPLYDWTPVMPPAGKFRGGWFDVDGILYARCTVPIVGSAQRIGEGFESAREAMPCGK